MERVEQESDWVPRARRGDREAADRLLSAHEEAVYGYLSQMLRCPADVDDALQEILLRALERLDQYRGPDRFRAWLFRIARHEVVDRWRRRRRMPGPTTENLDDLVDPRSDDDPLIRHEQSAALRAAIDRLPDVEREVVWMRLQSELSFREIADVTGAPLNTVLGRMHNAKQRLRGWLEPSRSP